MVGVSLPFDEARNPVILYQNTSVGIAVWLLCGWLGSRQW
jgi:hypothetical protein